MSLTLEEIQMALVEAGLDATARSKATKALREAEEAKKAESGSGNGPKAKNRLVICVRGDDKLKEVLQAGYVIKVPESSDNNTILTRIQTASAQQNSASKRKKNFIAKYSDFFGFSKRKFTKGVDIQPLTKQAVEVIVLPTEEINFG